VREAIKNWTEEQHTRAWKELPGLRHSKLFTNKPCKVRTESLLKLNRSQLRMITAVYTGHAHVRGHLFIIGLFEEDPNCRCCGMETETVQHIVCRREELARQRYDVFGKIIIEPKDISTASLRDLCFFIRSAGLLRLC
jgi:hypothetical protein